MRNNEFLRTKDFCPLPECTPMRIHTGIFGRCRSWKVPMKARMSSAMRQISTACLFPFRFGSPEATM